MSESSDLIGQVDDIPLKSLRFWNKRVIPGQGNHAYVLHTIARHRSALLLIYLTTHRPTLSLP